MPTTMQYIYREQVDGRVSVIEGLQADCLVVVDLDGIEDLVVNQRLENSSVDLAEELPGVDGRL